MAQTAEQITDPLLRFYTVVQPGGPGVCDVCHGAPGPGWSRCHSCSLALDQVSRPCGLVVPISLSVWNSQLHYCMSRYKKEGASDSVRLKFSLEIAAMLQRFLVNHRGCLAEKEGGHWDTVTTVPSSQGRAGMHPLEVAVRRSPWLEGQFVPLLKPGPTSTTHRVASDTGFVPTRSVAGRRILLLDDTFTSGCRSQSAASALNLAGAVVVAIVPVARYMNPGRWLPADEMMKNSEKRDFTFDYCCIGSHPVPPARP